MKEFILVGIGGLFGSISRYGISLACLRQWPEQNFPVATLVVNLLGCFLVGALLVVAQRSELYHAELRLLLVTGLIGGMTTFSALGLETVLLAKSGSFSFAFLNVTLNVALGLVATWFGLQIATRIVGAS